MAVNGGGQLVVQFSKTGFMPSQRKVQVPWQDFAISDDVVLIPLDPKVTTVDLASIPAGEVLEAQGTTQTDSDGTRTATLIFSSGTTAEMVMPDGTKTPITSLNMRATEYTVGENGPMAMPAVLPPTTAYTYMADFTADEALAAGATSIEFNQPVYGYVDNFLNVKPGEIVPNGFYDRVRGQWIPEGNGVVMDVINIDTSGATPIAELDLTGDGVADDHTVAPYDALNITPGELEKLAALYPNATPSTPAGLWRVPMMHGNFSNFHFALFASRAVEAGDDNYPIFLDATAIQNLEVRQAIIRKLINRCDECKGSTIQVQAQIFGEEVPVTGTPFTMHYNSDRGTRLPGGCQYGDPADRPETGVKRHLAQKYPAHCRYRRAQVSICLPVVCTSGRQNRSLFLCGMAWMLTGAKPQARSPRGLRSVTSTPFSLLALPQLQEGPLCRSAAPLLSAGPDRSCFLRGSTSRF